MKKLAIILAFLMLVPGAAFGMEMMNDSAMDDVTGQAGVSIAFDDVELFLNIEQIAWVDVDGLSQDPETSSTTSGGAVGIENFQIDTMKVNAIVGTAPGGSDLFSLEENTQFNYDGTTALNNFDEPAALSIDATNALPVLSVGHSVKEGNSVAEDPTEPVGGVMIGLPTVEVSIPSMSLTPKFWELNNTTTDGEVDAEVSTDSTSAATAYNHDTSYGRVDLGNITFTVLDGWMEIAPH